LIRSQARETLDSFNVAPESRRYERLSRRNDYISYMGECFSYIGELFSFM